jgi:hypothetical protein
VATRRPSFDAWHAKAAKAHRSRSKCLTCHNRAVASLCRAFKRKRDAGSHVSWMTFHDFLVAKHEYPLSYAGLLCHVNKCLGGP